MWKPLLAALLIAAVASPLAAQTPSALEPVLTQRYKTWMEAFLRGDGAAMDRLEHDDVMVVQPDGRVFAKERPRAGTLKALGTVPPFDVSDTRVRTSGEVAVLTGLETRVLASGREQRARFTTVWRRDGADWKVWSAQWAIAVPPPAGDAAAQGADAASAAGAEIRRLIAQRDNREAIPVTDDVVFWSGAYRRPTVGQEKPDEVENGRQPSLRVLGSDRSRTDVVRIELAASNDLAYEFSNAVLSFQLKDGGRRELTSSLLRVWKKEQGQWKVAAHFSRAHDAPIQQRKR